MKATLIWDVSFAHLDVLQKTAIDSFKEPSALFPLLFYRLAFERRTGLLVFFQLAVWSIGCNAEMGIIHVVELGKKTLKRGQRYGGDDEDLDCWAERACLNGAGRGWLGPLTEVRERSVEGVDGCGRQ